MIVTTASTGKRARPAATVLPDDGRTPSLPVVAVVVNAGPNGEDDDTSHNVYWVRLQRPYWNGTTGTIAFQDDTSGCLGTVEQATNISEANDSHQVATGGTQYVELRRTVEPFGWFFSTIIENKGELDGQVLQMTSQLNRGWGDLRLVNR